MGELVNSSSPRELAREEPEPGDGDTYGLDEISMIGISARARLVGRLELPAKSSELSQARLRAAVREGIRGLEGPAKMTTESSDETESGGRGSVLRGGVKGGLFFTFTGL